MMRSLLLRMNLFVILVCGDAQRLWLSVSSSSCSLSACNDSFSVSIRNVVMILRFFAWHDRRVLDLHLLFLLILLRFFLLFEQMRTLLFLLFVIIVHRVNRWLMIFGSRGFKSVSQHSLIHLLLLLVIFCYSCTIDISTLRSSSSCWKCKTTNLHFGVLADPMRLLWWVITIIW